MGQAVDVRGLSLATASNHKGRERHKPTALTGSRVFWLLIHVFKPKSADAIVKHGST
jgi:hypothetical protein